MKKLIFIIILAIAAGLFLRERDLEVTASPSISYSKTGTASWYSRRSPGIKRRTASNEIFNDQDLTCAMWGIAFGRHVKVTNLENGKSIIVRVNDRGPHHRYVRKGRVIDLTKEAFRQIGGLKKGIIRVEIEFL
ncbi:MAG: septal ring lytic transglycosylase RlpA family protein [Candidatus Omnitrophota bacterium]